LKYKRKMLISNAKYRMKLIFYVLNSIIYV